MTMYFFFQRKAKDPWEVALASDRDTIAQTVKPELTTALDVDNSFAEDDMTAEEIQAVKYSGDMYFDFDAKDLAEAITQVKQFVVNLQAKGVNVEALKFFASGSKGFHVIMPWEMLMAKMPAQGIVHLPSIYREVAFGLFVDCLDLSVYSAKKGRQFRCPNIQRDNGRYKVQITASELMAMDPERYIELCSEPRRLFRVEDPEFTPALGLLYSQARDKVERAAKRPKASRTDAETLSKFAGNWPNCLLALTSGEGVRENVGWNKIAMQLAITASCLGIDADRVLDDCCNLIDNHEGDGERYGTPEKRAKSLRDMCRYVDSNPCYGFSIGGLASVMMPGTDLTELETGPVDSAAEDDATDESDSDLKSSSAARNVRIGKSGIFFKFEEGWRCVTELQFSNLVRLEDVTMAFGDGGIARSGSTLLGYDVDVKIDDRGGKDTISLSNLISRQAFHNWTTKWGAGYRGTDMETTFLIDALRNSTRGADKVTYTIRSEGVDLVVKPNVAEKDNAYEIVYSSPRGVISTEGNQYTFRPSLNANGMFSSDLMLCSEMEDTPDTRTLIANLLEINSPENMAKLLGWFTAAFFCPIMRRFYMGKFPILQVFGQAGAGKSETIMLMSHLHYYLQSPRIMSATGQTKFPVKSALSASSSIPVVFEEVKPREMTKDLYDFLRNVFRSNYNAQGFASGTLNSESSVRSPVVNDVQNRGPVVFVGEAIEDQTAVLERCVSLNLSKTSRTGRREQFMYVQRNSTELGRLGKRIANYVMAMNIDAFREKFDAIHAEVWELAAGFDSDTKDRPLYNLAVALMGLVVFEDVLRRIFGEEFTPAIDAMRKSITSDLTSHLPSTVSEASKVMASLADLSHNRDPQYQLIYGVDYTVSSDGRFVDIKLKPCFEKYVRHCRSLGYQPLYDSPAAFVTAMGTYEGLESKFCPDNHELAGTLYNRVYRFNVAKMAKEEVGEFKS